MEGRGGGGQEKSSKQKGGVRDANGEGRELVSKDLKPNLDAVQSEFGVGYDRVICTPYGLPIKGYWQTVTVCQ